jgi:2-polyprenyl-3-methyl-5-hydroxy-6-metoxy-1,4-benzoquinol methylase
MKNCCILCGSSKIEAINEIYIPELINIYKLSGIAIEGDVKEIDKAILYRCQHCDVRYFSPANPGSPEFYEQLQDKEWYYPDGKDEFELAGKLIKNTDSVLEIGCGAGNFARYTNEEKYVGLEYTEKAVNLARSKGLQIKMQSIEAFSKENKECFDVVCFYQVLEHVPDPRGFLNDAINCLKPGGLLILSVPSEDSFLSFAVNNVLNMPPHHLTRWSDGSLRNLTSKFHLSLVGIQHEILADAHLQGYLEARLLRMMSPGYWRVTPLIDLSYIYKIKIKLSSLLIRMLVHVYKRLANRPRGHSVTAVYRKEN